MDYLKKNYIPIKQFTKEFRISTMDNRNLDVQINEFMDEWRKENTGNLAIESIYTIEWIYPGDQKKGTRLMVVFNWFPLTDAQAENIQLLNLARERKTK